MTDLRDASGARRPRYADGSDRSPSATVDRPPRVVAQLGRALRSGRRGREFKSPPPDHVTWNPVDPAFRVLQGGPSIVSLYVGGAHLVPATVEGWRIDAQVRSDERVELLRGVCLFERCTKAGAGCHRPHGDSGHRRNGRRVGNRRHPWSRVRRRGRGHRLGVEPWAGDRAGRPGSFFGELALLDGGPRTATVRALTPMLTLVLDRSAFDELLDRAIPSVGRRMLVTLAERDRSERLRSERLHARRLFLPSE